MSIVLKVKSENQTLADKVKEVIKKIFEPSKYNICDSEPQFGIELILQEIPSSQLCDRTKTDLIALSVNYVIYYSSWDFMPNIADTNKDIKERMFKLSHFLESNDHYATGANGIYKHCAYHNISVVPYPDLFNVCKNLVFDFNDMVHEWNDQTISNTEYLAKIKKALQEMTSR